MAEDQAVRRARMRLRMQALKVADLGQQLLQERRVLAELDAAYIAAVKDKYNVRSTCSQRPTTKSKKTKRT